MSQDPIELLRTATDEARHDIGDSTVRAVGWHFVRSSTGVLPYIFVRRVVLVSRCLLTQHHLTPSRTIDVAQISRYLYDQISSLPYHTESAAVYMLPWIKVYKHIRQSIRSWHYEWKLNTFFMVLNDCTNEKLMSRCAWLSLADGRTCVYNYPDSIAHHLDTLQQELLRSRINSLTICGININSDKELEHLVWSRTVAVHFSVLLGRLLQDRWGGSYEKIAELVVSMEDTSAKQLAWQPRLPSAIELSPEEPSLFAVDVLLNWVHERPEIDTFLGFEDWSIYLSEPYTRRPTLSALRVVMVTAKGSTKHRLMLITTSGGILAHLKQEQDHIIEANSADAIITTEDRIIKLLLASITLVITIIIQYISDVMKVIQSLVKDF
jgi:hypothetical protein